MSKINEEIVAHIARLSAISLSQADSDVMVAELEKVLIFVDALQAVNTDGVDPTSQVTGLRDVLREDVVYECDIKPAELLVRAPRHENGYVVVDRVLE